MNLEDALRYLFLRHLRADRIAAQPQGGPTADRIAALATALSVERDKEAKQYRVTITGTAHSWTFPESEFVFYTRGDRKAPPGVSTEDPVYEQNLTNARKWLSVFREAVDA